MNTDTEKPGETAAVTAIETVVPLDMEKPVLFMRQRSSLTCAEVAEARNVAQPTQSAIEHGHNPTWLSLTSTAKACGYEICIRPLGMDAPPPRPTLAVLSDKELMRLALSRAEEAKEPHPRSRLARLLNRDPSMINRVLEDGTAIGEDARKALEGHIASPGDRPLPPTKSAGRPRKETAS